MRRERPRDTFKREREALRRDQILHAAARVMARKGFHGARMHEVAKVAGISNGTVYNYFASKDELLLALLDRMNETDERPEQLGRMALEGDTGKTLERLMHHRFELWASQKDLVRALLPVILANDKLRRRYLADVIRPTFQLAENAFQDLGIRRPEALVRALAGSLFGLIVLDLLEDDESGDRAEETISVLSELFGSAIQERRGTA